MIIGLTGPTGAGKSEVSNYLKSKGFNIINADKLVHDIYVNCDLCIKAIDLEFPGVVSNSALDRKALAGIVFSDKQKLKRLNEVVNPYIIKRLSEEIDKLGSKHIILDAPTLFESGANSLCDKTIAVLSDKKLRLQRIISRDGLSESDAKLRINSQQKDDFYIEHADMTIRNDNAMSELKGEIDRVIDAWKQLA